MRTLFRFFILFWPGLLLAQGPLQTDLVALHTHLKRTKSYQQQFSARKEVKKHQSAFQDLTPKHDLDHLRFLVKFLSPIKDHHLALYAKPDLSLYTEYAPDRIILPCYEGVLEEQWPHDELAGKYDFGDWYSILMLPSEIEGEYFGVVTESKVAHWKRGEMAAWIQKRADGTLSAIYAHPYTKNYQWFSIERQQYGALLRSEVNINGKKMRYTKEEAHTEGMVSPPTPAFFHNKAGHYTRVKSFQKNPKTVKSNDSLLVQVRENLPEKFWIIDIRDQEGGAKSEMKKYWKVVKKYKGKVALLVNFNTLSQAELFALKAKKKAILMGDTTRGMLTYGSNYGKRIALPSEKWIFYPTDMLGWPPNLRYEGKGIAPDVVLSPGEDWIQQAKTYLTSIQD